jgi:zinc/manganese transport system permease protein
VTSLDFSILWPAALAGLLVTATHVPLGMQVLARGIVFIDLAIAQIAGCGVLLANRLGLEAEGVAVQVAALAAALGGSLLLTWTERIWPDVQEAVIGVVFVLAATGGILLLALWLRLGERLGLAASTALDLPSGPVIVWMLCVLGLAAYLAHGRATAVTNGNPPRAAA